jgi:hypothetical protein
MKLNNLIVLTATFGLIQIGFSQKWERAYKKDNVSISAGYGILATDALLISSENNFEGLQGEFQPSSNGPLYLGIETHRKDNQIVGVYYSYVSATSGAGLDDQFRLYQHQYSAHQITAKYSFGWYNSVDFGGMLYSGVQYGIKFATAETKYFEYVLVNNPEKYPYNVTSTAAQITLIGYKGSLMKNSPLALEAQLGFGDLGIISAGLNYTFK